MKITHFTDSRIEEIRTGNPAMTPDERQFLLADTLSFEECQHSAHDLEQMSDIDLMNTCYGIWADYVADLEL